MSEIVEIDWDNIPKNVTNFLRRELKKCKDNGVRIHMPSSTNLFDLSGNCSGYFDENPLTLAVAVKGSYKKWLPVFVHESCHMDQWLEQDPVWTKRVSRYKALNLFDKWLSGKIKLDKYIKKDLIDCILNIELDCEKRTVEKIIRNKLPIKLETYIRKSNAYVWSYRILQKTRSWDHCTVYDHPLVLKTMPTEFIEDYSRLPVEIREVFDLAMKDKK